MRNRFDDYVSSDMVMRNLSWIEMGLFTEYDDRWTVFLKDRRFWLSNGEERISRRGLSKRNRHYCSFSFRSSPDNSSHLFKCVVNLDELSCVPQRGKTPLFAASLVLSFKSGREHILDFVIEEDARRISCKMMAQCLNQKIKL